MAPVLKLVSPAPAAATRPAIEVAHLTKAFYDSEGDRVTLAGRAVTTLRGDLIGEAGAWEPRPAPAGG